VTTPDHARRAELISRYGKPGQGSKAEAVERLSLDVSPDDIYVGLYRDQMAADGWLAANLEDHGHPSLGSYPLEDGRVVGVLDLRPALRRARGDDPC